MLSLPICKVGPELRGLLPALVSKPSRSSGWWHVGLDNFLLGGAVVGSSAVALAAAAVIPGAFIKQAPSCFSCRQQGLQPDYCYVSWNDAG